MQRHLLALAVSAALGPMGLAAALAAEKAAAAPMPASPAASQARAAAAKPLPPVKRVDINSAGKAELKTLPGIGDAEAERIIQARPYPSKAKLAVDKVIPDALYAAIQGRIVAAQPATARARAPAKAASRP